MLMPDEPTGREHAARRKREPLSKNLLSLIAATLHPAAPHHLHSPEAIRAILHRECARCERSGSEFCLIIIDPGSAPLAKKQLGELLIKDARRADEVGYLDEEHLCAFLPYTAAIGAERFKVRFLEKAHALGWKPTIQTYAYPSDDFDGDGSPRDKQETDPSQKEDRRKVPHVAGIERMLARRSPLWKRATDVVVAGTALMMVWPLVLLIAMALGLTSKGPIFFTQWRLGLGGRPFRIFKFRTMVPNADHLKSAMLHQNEQDGPAFKMARDPRVTRIGRVLRSTSLDELPQLWNVLIGDMSLVGPRPLPVAESLACDTWQRRRLDVVPGLTCTWQISGRGTVSFDDWARMDQEYIRRRSFVHDVKLMALTVPAVLGRRGAM